HALSLHDALPIFDPFLQITPRKSRQFRLDLPSTFIAPLLAISTQPHSPNLAPRGDHSDGDSLRILGKQVLERARQPRPLTVGHPHPHLVSRQSGLPDAFRGPWELWGVHLLWGHLLPRHSRRRWNEDALVGLSLLGGHDERTTMPITGRMAKKATIAAISTSSRIASTAAAEIPATAISVRQIMASILNQSFP